MRDLLWHIWWETAFAASKLAHSRLQLINIWHLHLISRLNSSFKASQWIRLLVFLFFLPLANASTVERLLWTDWRPFTSNPVHWAWTRFILKLAEAKLFALINQFIYCFLFCADHCVIPSDCTCSPFRFSFLSTSRTGYKSVIGSHGNKFRA